MWPVTIGYSRGTTPLNQSPGWMMTDQCLTSSSPTEEEEMLTKTDSHSPLSEKEQ